jgi:hypothetical protein
MIAVPHPPGHFAWVLALVPALAAPLPAATPRDELLRFVPEDVGFCFVVQDIRTHSANLLNSPFAQQFRKSPFGKELAASAELRKLAKLERVLEQHLGINWRTLRDDVLGEAVVLAYRPGPPGKPGKDAGLALVRARRAATLASVIERFNKAQKKSGELEELTEREVKGVKYFRRVESKKTSYYYLRGPILAFSSQEEMLRQAILRERAASASAQPVVARKLRQMGFEKSAAALWLNPRAFDAAVKAQTGGGTFAATWKALQSIGLALDLKSTLSLSLAVRGKGDELPAPARRFLAEAGKPSALWGSFPENALFAVAGRFDVSALFELLGGFMPKDARRKMHKDLEGKLGAMLGRSVVKEVLPALGPDWGLCVSAPPPADKNWGPRVLFALRVGQGADADDPIDQSVRTALRAAALWFVLTNNVQHPDTPVRLKTQTIDKVKINYLEGERTFPGGVQPAFALKGGYLLLASSPAEVRRFRPAASASTDVPLLRVSFKGWRAYLKARREALASYLMERDKLTRPQARGRLDGIVQRLELVDRLELRRRSSPGQMTFTLTLQTAQPLKKADAPGKEGKPR